MRPLCALVALWLALAGEAQAATALLSPARDNTLYEISGGTLSNGAGQHLFAGVTVAGEIRRGLLLFDVAGSLPAGSLIQSASLRLNVSLEPLGNTSAHAFSLHRVSQDWGEGSSDAAGAEGGGASSTTGDATWEHRFFNTLLWSNAGGDFAGSASASQSFGPGLGNLVFSGASLAADVQTWLDSPAANFGWLIRGTESGTGSARRFDSSENPSVALRPVLEIQFTPPGGTPAVPAVPLWGWLGLALALVGTGRLAGRARSA